MPHPPLGLSSSIVDLRTLSPYFNTTFQALDFRSRHAICWLALSHDGHMIEDGWSSAVQSTNSTAHGDGAACKMYELHN